MPNSIHLICRREGLNLKGVTVENAAARLFRSVTWELSTAEAEKLVGGWVYFHPTKRARSEFGGIVRRIEPSGGVTAHGKPEVAIILEARAEARDQRWRGAAHGMAWTGGLVRMSLPHEVASGASEEQPGAGYGR